MITLLKFLKRWHVKENFSTFEKMLLSELMEEFGVRIKDERTEERKEETWVMLAERFMAQLALRRRTESLLEKLKGKSKKGCGRREEGDV